MQSGVCTYPEHRPQQRWPLDAELMRLTGLSQVRYAVRFPARKRRSLGGSIKPHTCKFDGKRLLFVYYRALQTSILKLKRL